MWDAPGHAASWPFAFDFDLMDKARWLDGILEQEGITKPVIVGQSMGGYVGQAYAQTYPEKLKGFVSIDSAPLAVTIAAYVLVCVAVGFYEEGAFRVILQDLFTRGFSSNGVRPERCALYAALLTSVLFAALHAASPLPADGDSAQIALQAILKFLQGALFGLAMAGLLAKTGSFALIVAVHTSYDLLFFLPWAISAGTFPSTYLTGLPIDTLALCANCVCLVPSAIVGIRQLVCGGAVQRRMG